MKLFIKKITGKAGRIALKYRVDLTKLVIDKKSKLDLVTAADRAVEIYIRSAILKKFPSHTVIGEEHGVTEGDDCCWIVDPIDGTAAYAHGLDHFCISIAYREKGKLLYGAVFAPALKRFFYAEAGKGAYLNGKRIFVSTRCKMSESIFVTGFACLRSELKDNNLPIFNHIAPQVRGIHRYGSAAYDLAMVAAGRVDGFWELNLNIYDIAAGVLLVIEAGGVVSNFSGGNYTPDEIVATNPLMQPLLLSEISKGRKSSLLK